MLGHGLTRNVAPGLNFLSDIFGNVVRPMLQSVEGYDPNRIIELPSHEVSDYCIEVCALDLGLAVHATATETVYHEVDRLIRSVRNGTRRPARSGHDNTPTQRNATQQEPGANQPNADHLVPSERSRPLSYLKTFGTGSPSTTRKSDPMRVLNRPAIVPYGAPSRLQLVVAAFDQSGWRCNLGSAQGARHWLGAPNTLPRRAASSFCQDYKPHSADTVTPSRASGVKFPFPSSLSFSPPYFLFLHRSHHDYHSELIFTFSAAAKARLVANYFRFGFT
jgi:hypothetical protein